MNNSQYFGEDEINLSKYFIMLWGNKWIITLIVFCTVIGTGVYISKIPKTYLAEGTILPLDEQGSAISSALGVLPLARLSGGTSSSDKLMIILDSRTIAKDVVNKLNIVSKLESLNPNKKDSFNFSSKLAGIFSFINNRKEIKEENTDQDILSVNRTKEEQAIDYLKKRTSLNQNKNGLVEIKVEWLSPKVSADIVNTYLLSMNEYLNNYSLNINYQIIDPAVPPANKYKPKVTQTLILSALISTLAGIFLVFIKEAVMMHRKNK